MNTETLLRQYRNHTKTLSNGDKVVGLPGHVYDLFTGQGWKNRIRFRLRTHKAIGGAVTKIESLTGFEISSALQQLLLKELT